jgi:hypothetical protein
MQPERRFLGLLRPRQCMIPTWRGWVLLIAFCVGLGELSIRVAYPFLSTSDSVPGGALVIEGWAPDQALRLALAEYNRGPYDCIYVTGGPIEEGAPLSDYKSFAELGAAILVKLGLNTNVVLAVPAPSVTQDRTYRSAMALREWCRKRGAPPTRINLMTVGPHARRSRLLFAKVFRESKVGVISLPPNDYDPAHWWDSSAGVRTVLSEVFAYAYVRCFFRVPKT